LYPACPCKKKHSEKSKCLNVLNNYGGGAQDLNPGHCGYEPEKADSSDSDLDRESKDHQELAEPKIDVLQRLFTAFLFGN